jgi:hypothetical protein
VCELLLPERQVENNIGVNDVETGTTHPDEQGERFNAIAYGKSNLP